ncbi:MAG: DUF2911 domain-containing protein [Ferruginibacter sp.]
MRNLLTTTAIAFCSFAVQAQVKMPQPSPGQTIEQDFGMGKIEVTYSRPAMRGRKVFGDLVPYGKLWRTGANSATTIKFTQPVEIMGKKVDTGTYALYTVPGVDNWEIILNKGTTNWGTGGYKESDDVIRIKAPAEKLKMEIENFTLLFDNVEPESIDLWMAWDKTGVRIPIKANIKDRLRADVENALKGEKKPYWTAAQFYNEYDKNYPLALDNLNKGIAENDKAYWMYLYKARIQKQMGDNAGAKTSSQKSLELARSEKNDDYVKLNEDFLKGLK